MHLQKPNPGTNWQPWFKKQQKSYKNKVYIYPNWIETLSQRGIEIAEGQFIQLTEFQQAVFLGFLSFSLFYTLMKNKVFEKKRKNHTLKQNCTQQWTMCGKRENTILYYDWRAVWELRNFSGLDKSFHRAPNRVRAATHWNHVSTVPLTWRATDALQLKKMCTGSEREWRKYPAEADVGFGDILLVVNFTLVSWHCTG